MWLWPLSKSREPVPEAPAPGAFGVRRRHYIHTGVDLYAPEGELVRAVEDGQVVNLGGFTGPEAGSPHWLTTDFIAVKGLSGIVVYGEVSCGMVDPGDSVEAGCVLGRVLRVIRNPKPGFLPSMLHLELYAREMGTTSSLYPVDWLLDAPRPVGLLNPTAQLVRARQGT